MTTPDQPGRRTPLRRLSRVPRPLPLGLSGAELRAELRARFVDRPATAADFTAAAEAGYADAVQQLRAEVTRAPTTVAVGTAGRRPGPGTDLA